MKKLLLLLLVSLAGCHLGQTADRATYEAVAPEYLGYVDADPLLTTEQKARRHETVRSWEAKTKAPAEGEAGR